MTKKVTVPWMDKIRERLKDTPRYGELPYRYQLYIIDFINPILEYGESVEKRINEEYDKNTKTWESIKAKEKILERAISDLPRTLRRKRK